MAFGVVFISQFNLKRGERYIYKVVIQSFFEEVEYNVIVTTPKYGNLGWS